MRILITGAGGMLGHDVAVATRAAGHEPVALTRAACDIADPASVVAAVADAGPEAVINCAAWTNVDAAESESEAALSVNGDGAGHVAAAAAAAGAWTVHISTDYVFDGAKRTPYLESDPVGPLQAYGRTKLAGESAVATAAPDSHTVVRTAWVFGAHGACFPKTMLRLAAERDELTVVDDQVGSPTFTGHLATALVALAERQPLGLNHVTGGEECSWCEFAAAVIDASDRTCTVRGIPTSQYPTPAPRPAYSVLRSERGAPALPSWRVGLEAFMSELTEVSA